MFSTIGQVHIMAFMQIYSHTYKYKNNFEISSCFSRLFQEQESPHNQNSNNNFIKQQQCDNERNIRSQKMKCE